MVYVDDDSTVESGVWTMNDGGWKVGDEKWRDELEEKVRFRRASVILVSRERKSQQCELFGSNLHQ